MLSRGSGWPLQRACDRGCAPCPPPPQSFLLLPQGPPSLPHEALHQASPPTALLSGSPLACCYLSQDHLQHCLFQAVQCSNESCREPVLRKDLKEHLSADCPFREEKCLYCKKDVVVINLQVKKKKNHLYGTKFCLSGHSESGGIPEALFWIYFYAERGLKNNFI